MPPYVAVPDSQNSPVILLQPGVPAYAMGSKKNGPTCRMVITNVALSGNVATVTVGIIDGDIPSTSGLITILGTSTAGGAFNVSQVPITGVSINAQTGVGTITFALTHANVAPTSDSGMGYVPVPEIGEAAASGNKSQQFAIQNAIGRGYGISWAFTYPSAPVSGSIQLEGAINDQDAEYTIIGSASTVVNAYTETFATLPELVNFVRLHQTALSGGTNPTVIGKILLS